MGLFSSKSSSTSSNETLNQTTNDVTNIDKRNVASDQAVGLTGDGSWIDRSSWAQDNTNNSTWMQDNSKRSSSTITQMFDNANRSTNFSDSSVRDSSTFFSDSSVRTDSHATSLFDYSKKSDSHDTSMVDNSNRSVSYNTTDYGSVGKALDSLGMMSSKSLDVAAGGVAGSIEALKYLADQQQKSVTAAFDLTRSASSNALGNSAQVMGFANSALEKTAAAYAQARDGGESKNIMYALAAVAVVGVAFALKN